MKKEMHTARSYLIVKHKHRVIVFERGWNGWIDTFHGGGEGLGVCTRRSHAAVWYLNCKHSVPTPLQHTPNTPNERHTPQTNPPQNTNPSHILPNPNVPKNHTIPPHTPDAHDTSPLHVSSVRAHFFFQREETAVSCWNGTELLCCGCPLFWTSRGGGRRG